MTAVFYALIIFPIIFMMVLSFVFSSSLSTINVQQLKINCPYPINSGVATNLNIVGTIVTYNVTYDNSTSNYHVTVFHCGDGETMNANTAVYTTANNWYNVASVAGGYMFYISETITEFFHKVIAVATLIYSLINAPAQVTGLTWFSYVNIIFISFIAIGVFMVVRG